MARKHFAKERLGWHNDPRCINLKTASAKWLNSRLWNIAVELRCETLPEWIDIPYLVAISRLDVRTVRKGLEIMQGKMCGPLIEIIDGRITVFGVREIHETKKFPFKDDYYDGLDDKSERINAGNNDAKLPSISKTEKKKSKRREEEEEDQDSISLIAEFYKTNINPVGIETGRLNLQKIHEFEDIPYSELFDRVRNYLHLVEEKRKKGEVLTYQMNNFFGDSQYHIDFLEKTAWSPPEASESAPAKDLRKQVEEIKRKKEAENV